MENESEFDNQRPHEKIIILGKRHPWILARIAFYAVLIIVAIFLSFLIWKTSLIAIIFLIVGLLLIVFLGLTRWFVYNNDIFILTNERIINIEQGSFFTRRVTEAELENILNVSYEIRGPIKSLLNFGDISIDTSGSDRNILILKNVQNPYFVQEKIVSLQKKSHHQEQDSNPNILR